MRARDLAVDYPVVPIDGDALEAARLLAGQRLPGLLVVDTNAAPVAILPGSQVLNFIIPGYVQEDPALARVYDEAAADELSRRLAGRSVRELLPRRELATVEVVHGGATTLEVAAVMARMHSPLVAVVEGGRVLGAITANALLEKVLPPA